MTGKTSNATRGTGTRCYRNTWACTLPRLRNRHGRKGSGMWGGQRPIKSAPGHRAGGQREKGRTKDMDSGAICRSGIPYKGPYKSVKESGLYPESPVSHRHVLGTWSFLSR